MKLFHITKNEYVNSILKYGLQVCHSNLGLSRSNRNIQNSVIWLTDNIDYIFETQIGVDDKKLYSIFVVDVTDFVLGARTVYPAGKLVICPHEYFVSSNINPSKLTLKYG